MSRPPPAVDFFTSPESTIEIPSGSSGHFARNFISIRDQKLDFEVKSPVRQHIRYPETIELDADSIDFGVLVGQKSMSVLRSLRGTYSHKVKLILNLRRRQIAVHFFTTIANTLRHVRFFVAFEDLQRITQAYDHGVRDKTYYILHLPGPPLYSKFLQDQISETHVPNSVTWKADDAWFRQTSIESTKDSLDNLKGAPANLRKVQASIDIGRWTTYRLTFNKATVNSDAFRVAGNAFRDFNVPIEAEYDFSFVNPRPAVFDFIDPPFRVAPKEKRRSSLEADLAQPTQEAVKLSFPLRYELEVCISNNWLCEYSLGRNFLRELGQLPESKAVQVLEHVAVLGKRFHDPMEIFRLPALKIPKLKVKLPLHCNVIRNAVVTATTIIYNPPTVEMTNRVVRQFHSNADRFLRVRFEDDKFRGNSKIYATEFKDTVELFTRIKRVLTNGIMLGDHHYEFVAFGNSQLREHGAYFFASTPYLSASNIRAWLGSFDKEKIVAKHAARMGQCFSTTRAILGTRVRRPTEALLIEDITRNGHTFSDGVGKMSPFLAQLIAMELGLNVQTRSVPSCYQFRLGGCKGVLAVSTDLKALQIELRRSQFKFDTQHHGLEIIRWAQFWNASLNRQLIIVLSFLGVKDHIFLGHQERLIQLLERAMCNDEAAQEGLHASVDPNHMTLTLSSMVSDGFRGVGEPFVTSCLRLWRAWSIKYLKEKAKIPVRNGACVLGVVDETASLRGHFNNRQPPKFASSQQKEEALPEIFIQITRSDTGEPEIITGKCILARNPSLHPGDIRVVRAVHVKALEHHRDVVVLPQTGDQDLSSMCSGGDLDGDDYVVIWDQDFLPKTWFHEPMDYTPPTPARVEGEVTLNDITNFYVNYMRQDFLGQIAHAHLAWADDPDVGLAHPTCLRLAQLHSQAVDYPKTGVPATYPRELRPFKWPHFMEKKGKEPHQTRWSRQILGQLYDAVERVKFVPNYSGSFDERILRAYKPSQEMINAAEEIKQEYDDAMQRIMAQHEIKSEFEVWTTFVLSHSQASGDFKFHEQIGRLSADLKDRFRKTCVEQVGGEHSAAIAPFAVAMYMVTERQLREALRDVESGKRKGCNMPFISFPWLLQDTLGSIASGLHNWGKTNVKASTVANPAMSEIPMTESQFEITQGLPLSEEDKRRLLEERNTPISSLDSAGRANVRSGHRPQAKSQGVKAIQPPKATRENVLGFEVSQGLSLSEDDKRRLLAERTRPVSNTGYSQEKHSENKAPLAKQPSPGSRGALVGKMTIENTLVPPGGGDEHGSSTALAKPNLEYSSHQTDDSSLEPDSALALLEREFKAQPSTPVDPKIANTSSFFDRLSGGGALASRLGPAASGNISASNSVFAVNQDPILYGNGSRSTSVPGERGRERVSSGESDMWELMDSEQLGSSVAAASPQQNNSPIVADNWNAIDSLIDMDLDVTPKAKTFQTQKHEEKPNGVRTSSNIHLLGSSKADKDSGIAMIHHNDTNVDVSLGKAEAGNDDESGDDDEEEVIEDPFQGQETAWGKLAEMNKKMR